MNASELLERYAAGERDFPSAKLRYANLDGVNLRGANLEGADLRDADLEKADLEGADLPLTNFCGASLIEANLANVNLEGAKLCSANLQAVNLSDANLKGADLFNANLKGANLLGANLEGADLRLANLFNAKLQGANLKDANLELDHLKMTKPSIGLGFWIEWVAATLLGSAVTLWSSYWINILSFFITGLVTGIGQWVLLNKPVFRMSSWGLMWIPATAFCWFLSVLVYTMANLDRVANEPLLSIAVSGFVYGSLIGVTKCFIVENVSQKTKWWILGNGVGVAVGCSVIWLLPTYIPELDPFISMYYWLLGWSIEGAITGGVLVWLIRHSRNIERGKLSEGRE